jgi:hypothetical protein
MGTHNERVTDAITKQTDIGTFTGTTTGTEFPRDSKVSTFQLTSTGAHTNASTMVIEGRLGAAHLWVELGTITVNGASDSDGFTTSECNWLEVRGRCTAYGTGGSILLSMGD